MACFADFEEYMDMVRPVLRNRTVSGIALMRYGWVAVSHDEEFPLYVAFNANKVTQALQKAVILGVPIQE